MSYRPRDGIGPPKSRITSNQRHMLAKATPEWRSIWAVGAANSTNLTLSNLERRGLVELRIDRSEGFTAWQVRLTPSPSTHGERDG